MQTFGPKQLQRQTYSLAWHNEMIVSGNSSPKQKMPHQKKRVIILSVAELREATK